jgi:hypothetical protein
MLAEKNYLLALNVNAWLPARAQRMVRTLDGYARALLSDRFRTLDNVDLFFSAAKVFKEVGAEIIRADLSEDRFYLRAINPNLSAEIKEHSGDIKSGKIDHLFGGIVLSNSEVGAGSLHIERYGYRQICSNGMVGESLMSRTHLGERLDEGIYEQDTVRVTTEAIWLQARDMIRDAFKELRIQEWADQLAGTKAVDLPAVTKLASGSWKGLDVSIDERNAILDHLLRDGEGLTQFGITQAVTATARDASNADRRQVLERMGFELSSQKPENFEQTMIAVCQPPRGERQ